MANDIKSDYWRKQLDDHGGERKGGVDVDIAVAVSDGGYNKSSCCLIRLKNGDFMYLKREFKNGVAISESSIVGPRAICELNIPADIKKRLKL